MRLFKEVGGLWLHFSRRWMNGLEFFANFNLPVVEKLAFIVPGPVIDLLRWEVYDRLHVWYIRLFGSFAWWSNLISSCVV